MHKKLTNKEVTKNLLKGNSCENCLVSMSVRFMMKGEAERIMKKSNCEAKLIMEKSRLEWLSPDAGICKRYIQDNIRV